MLVTMSDKELLRASFIQAVVEKRPLLAQSGRSLMNVCCGRKANGRPEPPWVCSIRIAHCQNQ